MALLPKIQNKDVYSFKDAQALINPSNVSSEKGKAISTDLYNRVYQAEKQSNEELLEQLKDMSVIRNVIEEVVPDEKERTELYAQYSALQRALEENSSSLNSFSKTITQSFMKKGLGKNGQFTQAQDILMSVGGGIKGELFPVFQGIIDQTSTFFKNRSDRKERVEEDIMKNIGSKSSFNTTMEEQFSSERKNFSDVTNGDNSSILEHIDVNVEELLSKFKTEDGRIDAFKVESFLSELSEKLGEPLEAEAFGEAMRDILSVELSKLSSEQIKEFKDSMKSENGNLLLEKSVSFDGYNKDEKPVIIDTLKEMMSSQADLLMNPKREMKDFTSLEAQEEYQRDSIKEERRTADGIEKLCGILTGEKRKSSIDGNSGGGIISNLIDSGKDLLLTKMRLDKFFGKDKASKGGMIKKTLGGLSSKGGEIFKKVGGWLTAFGGGALLSGGGTSDIGDVATDVLTDTATDKVIDRVKPSSKPKSSIFSKLKNAFNIVKESKAVNAIKEGGMKLVRFGGDKAVQGARTVAQTIAANPLTSATVGAVIAAGAANKYAHNELKTTETGRSVLEATDGNLLGEDVDLDAIGGTLDIADKGLDSFGNVKDEEKYFESVQEKSKEAWNEANKDTEGFRTIASGYKDKKVAWEVWNRGNYEKLYNIRKNNETGLKKLNESFAKDYSDAVYLNSAGLYFGRDKLAQNIMDAGGKLEYHDETNPQLVPAVAVTKDKAGNELGRAEYAENKFLNQNLRVTENKDGSKNLSVFHNTGTTYSESNIVHGVGKWSNKSTYEDSASDVTTFTDVSELKDAAPIQIKELETEKADFHNSVLSDFTDGVKDYNPYVGWDAYAPYMFQVKSAYLEKDEDIRKTLLDKIKKNFLKTYNEKYKAFSEIQNTKEDVTSKSSSIPVLSETETITDIDHDYSQSSFDDVSSSNKSNIPTVPPSQPTKDDVTTTRNSNVSEYQNDDGTWMSNRQIKEKINYDERINNASTQEEIDLIYREKMKAEQDRDVAYSKAMSNYSNHTRSTWLGQVRAGTHEIHSSKEQQITQQPSNSTRNEAYTSQPTRTSVPEKKDTSTTKQETKQQPTVINNFNTTNNNVTQSTPQKSPQLIINPSPSYMGERQPTAR